MRYNFYYVLNLLDKLPADIKMKLRSYIKVDNLHYEFTSYETNLTEILCQRFPNTVKTKLKQTQERITKHRSRSNKSRNMEIDIQSQDNFNGTKLAPGSRRQNNMKNIVERDIWNNVSIAQRPEFPNRERNSNLLKRMTRKREKHFGKKNLLIINTGHWSLKYRTLLDHLIDMNTVAEAVKRLKSSNIGKNSRIIWFTSVPFNFYDAQSNNFAAMAANHYITKHLFEDTDIEIFDQFSLIYTRLEHQVCHTHYLCLENKKGVPKVYGSVGQENINYFLEDMLNC